MGQWWVQVEKDGLALDVYGLASCREPVIMLALDEKWTQIIQTSPESLQTLVQKAYEDRLEIIQVFNASNLAEEWEHYSIRSFLMEHKDDRINLIELCKAVISSSYSSKSLRKTLAEIIEALGKREAKSQMIRQRRVQFANQYETLFLKLLSATDYKCQQCGDSNALTIDHKIPLSKGGTDELSNLQFLCRKHNSQKHDKMPMEVTT